MSIGGKTEPSGLTEQTQIQNIFFAKDTISELNKTILQNQILQNLPRESKQEIIDILIKNMKTVYKNLDISKINQTNIQSIHGQFKKISLEQTINDINKHTNYLKSPTELKFQRDFTSNPNKGNKLMDRPESTKSTQQVKQPSLTNTKPGVNFNLNANTNNFDDAFKPMIDGLQMVNESIKPGSTMQGMKQSDLPSITTEQNVFNNYSSDKNIEDIKTRMQVIQQSRDNELVLKQQRPTTPDFLKSKKTSIKQEETSTNITNKVNNNVNTKTTAPDFKNMNSMQFNEAFNGLLNDTGDNLYSLDNIDKLLVDTEIVEDTANFEDRLKRLQSERTNITAPKPQSKIDFTSSDFPSSNFPIQNTDNIQQQYQPEQKQQYQPEQKQQYQPEQKQQYQPEQKQQYQPEQKQQYQPEQKQQYQQQTSNNKIAELKTSLQSHNININERTNSITQKFQQYQDKIISLETENNELIELINKLENDINNSNELEKITQIKNQIAAEFTELTIKNENIDVLSSQLKLKEVQLNTKETTLNELIAKYDYLFKSEYIQFEVSNPENKSAYTWTLELITNIIGIKLMTYSIPLPRFNIEENKNNIFSFKLNNEEHSIILLTGKYTIDELITTLDEKIKTINKTLTICINTEQKVIFKSSNVEDNIIIINTMLSKENLGFLVNTPDQKIEEETIVEENIVEENIVEENIVEENIVEENIVEEKIKPNTQNHNIQIANKCWDLRIDNKVYLYLNNLSEEIPFGILYFNGNAVSQFKFEKPFNLTNLEIIFKDSYGMPYNFHNLPHSLTFLIEKVN
jgi:hypothetical protein